MRKGIWINKKFGITEFVGSYERDKDNERVFVLKSKKRKITFESYQHAKKTGWEKH